MQLYLHSVRPARRPASMLLARAQRLQRERGCLAQRLQFMHALPTLTGKPAPDFTLAPPPVPVGLPSDFCNGASIWPQPNGH